MSTPATIIAGKSYAIEAVDGQPPERLEQFVAGASDPLIHVELAGGLDFTGKGYVTTLADESGPCVRFLQKSEEQKDERLWLVARGTDGFYAATVSPAQPSPTK